MRERPGVAHGGRPDVSGDYYAVWRRKEFPKFVAEVVDLSFGRARLTTVRRLGDVFLLDAW